MGRSADDGLARLTAALGLAMFTAEAPGCEATFSDGVRLWTTLDTEAVEATGADSAKSA